MLDISHREGDDRREDTGWTVNSTLEGEIIVEVKHENN